MHDMTHTPLRDYSRLDQCLIHVDQAMRTVFGHPIPARPNPASHIPEMTLLPRERRQSIGLMRVNHAGEVSAQALYHAQALTARSKQTRLSMQHAAEEENDHLAWCQDRLDEMGGRTSYLSAFWYLGSFAIGTTAGLLGDRWSLGFLAETENQVVQHLNGHLECLPVHDHKSRCIVEQMRQDEHEHATTAVKAGAHSLPSPIKKIMRLFSKVMTKTAYYI